MVILYQKNQIPFPHYVKNKIIEKVINVEPENYILIESKSCACDTRNGISVKDKSIYLNSKENKVISHIYYSIDYETDQEFETAVLWLVKSKFCTPMFEIKKILVQSPSFDISKTQKNEEETDDEQTEVEEKETKKKNYVYQTENYMKTECFRPPVTLICDCEKYVRRGVPIFCTKEKVVFKQQEGLTVKEVIKKTCFSRD
jgi:hypothetical protein